MTSVAHRSRTLAVLAAAFAIVGATAGCSVSENLSMPDCREGGSVIIAAQSVPSAEFVPCLEPLPDGWMVESVAVTQEGTRVRFDSDRAGAGAAELRYDEECDVARAVSAPSDQPGTDRHDLVERVDPSYEGQVFYTFGGGCVWWTFEFDDDAPAALAIELGDRLVLVSRQEFVDDVRRTFVDEEF